MTAAEDAAVAATDKRDAFLRERDQVTPATELAIVGPELATARLCATGAVVPPGGDPATCQAQLDQLQQQVATLGQDADQLAALDRDLAQAESDVADATRDQRDADTAAARAAIGPVVEVAQAGTPVSRVPACCAGRWPSSSARSCSAWRWSSPSPSSTTRIGAPGPRRARTSVTGASERPRDRDRCSVSKLEDPPDRPASVVTGRSEVVHVARGGGLNLAGSLINTGSVLALFWVLDHHLGQTLTGVYIQAFALRRILQTIALGGMRSAMTRFVAIDLADDDDASLRGTIAVGIAVSVGLAAILGVILFFAAPWVATSVYGDPELVAGLRWVAVGLPSAAFTIVVLSATTGWRTMRPNAIVGSMFEPILRVVLTAVALTLGAGLTGSLIMLQVASVIASVVAWIWLRRLMRGHARRQARLPHRGPHTVRPGDVGLLRRARRDPMGRRPGPGRPDHRRRRGRVPGGHPHRPVLRARRQRPHGCPRAPRCGPAAPRRAVRRAPALRHHLGHPRAHHPALAGGGARPGRLAARRSSASDYTGAAWISRILVFGVLYDTAVGAAGPILNMAGLQLYNLADNVGRPDPERHPQHHAGAVVPRPGCRRGRGRSRSSPSVRPGSCR